MVTLLYKDLKTCSFTHEQLAVKEILQMVADIEPEFSNDENTEAIFWGFDTDCGSAEHIINSGVEILHKYNITHKDN